MNPFQNGRHRCSTESRSGAQKHVFEKNGKNLEIPLWLGGSSGARKTCFPENASPPQMQDGWRRAGNKAGMFGLVNHED